jgi:FlaA1/EpsC-like NDP-sugar epimerase
MQADKDHLHHRLLNYGLKQYHVALVLYAVNSLIVGTGLLILIYQETAIGLFLVIAIITLYLLIKYVLQIELWETQRLMARTDNKPQLTRFGLLFYALFDLSWLAVSLYLASFVALSGGVVIYSLSDWLAQLPLWELPIFFLLFYTNSYIKIWRNSFFKDYLLLMAVILIGCIISFALLSFLNKQAGFFLINQMLLFCLFALLGIVGVRIPHHFLSAWSLTNSHNYSKNRRNVLLYGAGSHGGLYLRERYLNHTNELGAINIIGFIDDNILLRKQFIYGQRVFGDLTELTDLIKKYAIDEIILTADISEQSLIQLKAIVAQQPIKLLKWRASTTLLNID